MIPAQHFHTLERKDPTVDGRRQIRKFQRAFLFYGAIVQHGIISFLILIFDRRTKYNRNRILCLLSPLLSSSYILYRNYPGPSFQLSIYIISLSRRHLGSRKVKKSPWYHPYTNKLEYISLVQSFSTLQWYARHTSLNSNWYPCKTDSKLTSVTKLWAHFRSRKNTLDPSEVFTSSNAVDEPTSAAIKTGVDASLSP